MGRNMYLTTQLARTNEPVIPAAWTKRTRNNGCTSDVAKPAVDSKLILAIRVDNIDVASDKMNQGTVPQTTIPYTHVIW
jgi:hypothetical protein